MGIDQGAKKLLETATIETLHAHNFSRSSTQATLVLTDLLSRYFTVLTTTCAKYAEHAGRSRLTAKDAICALDDLGVDVEELSEYCASEGKEMSRYAVHTARRIEDLNEFKASLTAGLREDRDDAVPLVYGPIPSLPSSDEEYEESEAEWEQEEGLQLPEIRMDGDKPEDVIAVERVLKRHSPPPLPLSPISNPPSPPRKRPRTASWNPPPHIPSFLPPFPTDTPRHTPSPPPLDLHPVAPPSVEPVKVEPIPLPASQETTSSKPPGDWVTPTPYELSGLASQPTWHLPLKPPTPPPSPPNRLPVPMAEPALLGAYHYILTHHPKTKLDQFHPGPTNPGRYKVALELVRQAETQPRWDPPPTLFASTAPNAPRVAAIAPSYPIPYGKLAEEEKDMKPSKGGKDRDMEEAKLPPTQPKIVAGIDRLSPLVSQPYTRIPALARELLSVSNTYPIINVLPLMHRSSVLYITERHDYHIQMSLLAERRNWCMVNQLLRRGTLHRRQQKARRLPVGKRKRRIRIW
ncbi:unnamed protein product [Somion occarium]|uniref:Bromodomain associated domain-containing protein n=1 Tax=Somion occarium TaxID=3059160 RepID=A0ABP1CQR1_9APHY